MIRAPCFLRSLQCSLVHLLGLNHLALILIKITQVIKSGDCGYMLKAPCFLFFLQCPLVHLLGLGHLALISIENAQVVESITNFLVLDCTRNFDGGELLYTSICIREQALLHQPIPWLHFFRHSTPNDPRSQHHQLKLISTDGLETPIVNNRVNRVALGILMWFDQ